VGLRALREENTGVQNNAETTRTPPFMPRDATEGRDLGVDSLVDGSRPGNLAAARDRR
jgi:hypothetical protein